MKLSLSAKLYGINALLLFIGFFVGILGLWGIRRINKGLETVYKDSVIPIEQLNAISNSYAISIIDATNKTNAGLLTAEDAVRGLRSARGTIREKWAQYMSGSHTAEERALAAQADKLIGEADAAVAQLETFFTGKTGNLAGQLGEYDGMLYQHVDPITGKIEELTALQLQAAKEEHESAHALYLSLLFVGGGIMLGGIVVGGLLAWRISSGLSRSLTAAIHAIDDGSAQVASAAAQVSSASSQLAEGASEQAASLEETSSSLEEMSSMTASNAKSAQEAKAVADEMHSVADTSNEEMRQMQAAMDAIKESSAGISQIIKTIDEIAFQTNILALNAAVEAARAGEAGAGFAVVAEEVRNLAQRSAQSAKETSSKIEGAIHNSERGVTLSGKVAESLTRIVEKAGAMNSLVASIANASSEQDKGIGQLTTAVQQMDKVTQSNASSAEETASASEELNAHASSLKETVYELSLLVNGGRADTPGAGAFARSMSIAPQRAVSTGAASSAGKAKRAVPAHGHFLPMQAGKDAVAHPSV
jgi:uncharacterized phage infection (PIP) family protein YhgE